MRYEIFYVLSLCTVFAIKLSAVDMHCCYKKVTMMIVLVDLYLISWCFFFLRLLAMLDEDEEDRVDETALQQLTEMGFPESRAIKALRLNQ